MRRRAIHSISCHCWSEPHLAPRLNFGHRKSVGEDPLNFISSLDNLRFALKANVINQPHFRSPHKLDVLIVGNGSGPSYKSIFTGINVSIHRTRPDDVGQNASGLDVIVVGPDVPATSPLLDHLQSLLGTNGVLIVAGEPIANWKPHQEVRTHHWKSPFGPSFETITSLCHGASANISAPDLSLTLATPVQNTFPPNVPDEVEHGAGTLDCYQFLVELHQHVRPRFYTEIGVEYGASLKLAACPALGIDPAPQLSQALPTMHSVSLTTSDDFFRLADTTAMRSIDLCYIDGMHQIEFALKDFMNMERFCHAGSVVIVDDIYPAHPLQGERIRQSRYWTGDIWKIIPILERYRPDLIVLPVDTEPTGSLMVLGLDPTNNVLWDNFDTIIDDAIDNMSEVPSSIVDRTGKIDAHAKVIRKILRIVRKRRGTPRINEGLDQIRKILQQPKLREVRRR